MFSLGYCWLDLLVGRCSIIYYNNNFIMVRRKKVLYSVISKDPVTIVINYCDKKNSGTPFIFLKHCQNFLGDGA